MDKELIRKKIQELEALKGGAGGGAPLKESDVYAPQSPFDLDMFKKLKNKLNSMNDSQMKQIFDMVSKQTGMPKSEIEKVLGSI